MIWASIPTPQGNRSMLKKHDEPQHKWESAFISCVVRYQVRRSALFEDLDQVPQGHRNLLKLC